MEWNERKAKEAIASFAFGPEEIVAASEVFRSEMEKGIAGDKSSTLAPLPSFLGLPSGDEQGDFIALDFGGTNVRAERVRLFGGGKFERAARVVKPLIVPGQYNHAGGGETAQGLFDFIVGIIDAVLGGDHETPYRLGPTFSFPAVQESPRDARLLSWTKELSVSDVEGRWVNEQLNEALRARGLTNVRPAAILNDTVAVLLAAAYQWEAVAIGSIYATGFNACYLETFGGEREPMIMNLEAGNFGWFDQNEYDAALDKASEKPGAQMLEKMVSGRYVGALFSQALGDIMGATFPAVTGEEIYHIIRGEGKPLLRSMTQGSLSEEQMQETVALAEAIVRRSARIVAAVYAGILRHTGGNGKDGGAIIAVEGSFFMHMAMARATLHEAMKELLGDDAERVQVWQVTGCASVGAAIAAAMIDQ
ncbi:MAG: hexokinase [Schwartzia sp.]|nr:hexokinase [Schwartzia sp. (in: firmicutes)]